MWNTLRKTAAHIYLEHEHSYTNNLHADDIRVQVVGDVVTVSFDLNRNLKTRNKQEFSYVDAKELADGEIATLKSLQCDDDKVITTLAAVLQAQSSPPSAWQLVVELGGSHAFPVALAHDDHSITFNVLPPPK